MTEHPVVAGCAHQVCYRQIGRDLQCGPPPTLGHQQVSDAHEWSVILEFQRRRSSATCLCKLRQFVTNRCEESPVAFSCHSGNTL
jgi:hypothetical protein